MQFDVLRIVLINWIKHQIQRICCGVVREYADFCGSSSIIASNLVKCQRSCGRIGVFKYYRYDIENVSKNVRENWSLSMQSMIFPAFLTKLYNSQPAPEIPRNPLTPSRKSAIIGYTEREKFPTGFPTGFSTEFSTGFCNESLHLSQPQPRQKQCR